MKRKMERMDETARSVYKLLYKKYNDVSIFSSTEVINLESIKEAVEKVNVKNLKVPKDTSHGRDRYVTLMGINRQKENLELLGGWDYEFGSPWCTKQNNEYYVCQGGARILAKQEILQKHEQTETGNDHSNCEFCNNNKDIDVIIVKDDDATRRCVELYNYVGSRATLQLRIEFKMVSYIYFERIRSNNISSKLNDSWLTTNVLGEKSNLLNNLRKGTTDVQYIRKVKYLQQIAMYSHLLFTIYFKRNNDSEDDVIIQIILDLFGQKSDRNLLAAMVYLFEDIYLDLDNKFKNQIFQNDVMINIILFSLFTFSMFCHQCKRNKDFIPKKHTKYFIYSIIELVVHKVDILDYSLSIKDTEGNTTNQQGIQNIIIRIGYISDFFLSHDSEKKFTYVHEWISDKNDDI